MELLPAYCGIANSVYQAEALDLMAWLWRQGVTVDLIATDLPYGQTACSWDEVIPFAPMWAAVKRILKPRGVFVTTASQPFTSALVMSNPRWFKYEWIWDKKTATGGQTANTRPMKAHENVLVFSSEVSRYFPIMETLTRQEEQKMRKHDVVCLAPRVGGSENISKGWYEGKLKYPRSVIRITGITPVSDEKQLGNHPTQKPVELYRYLIETYTQPGELVLDFCCGSGTTALAARECGRRYIVSDTSADYVAITRDRLRLPFEPRAVKHDNNVMDLPLFADIA